MERTTYILILMLCTGVIVQAMDDNSATKDEPHQAHSQRDKTIYDTYQDMGLVLLARIGLAPSNWGDYRRRPSKWDIVAASMTQEEKDKED